ncbi:hypothetical protein RV10_GL003043 [Enterococcus pallens]|nr:hypothetical protein RV10_GL003043 [Enterococcus pallens]
MLLLLSIVGSIITVLLKQEKGLLSKLLLNFKKSYEEIG